MIAVEYIKDNYEHENVNSSVIAILLSAFPDEKLNLFCGRAHYDVIRQYLSKNNIPFNKLVHNKITFNHNVVRDYKLILYDFKIVKKIFDFAKKNNEDKIYFMYTTTFMLYYLKLFCLFNPKIKVITAIHSELERIDFLKYAKTFDKNHIIFFLYALFFGLRIPLSLYTPKNLKFLVYRDAIKENATRIIPSVKNSMVSVPHPYIYNNQPHKIPDKNNLKLGIIGVLLRRKNIFYLEKLFNKLESLGCEKLFFLFSGMIMDKEFFDYISKLDFVDKSTLSFSKMIPTEKRDATIKQMDYAVFTYNTDSYKLIASGAFSDAINLEKPIIALKNDYFESYFKKYGNIGYMLNSYDEFESTILSLAENFSLEEYNVQVANIRKIKTEESINNNAEVIKGYFSDFDN